MKSLEIREWALPIATCILGAIIGIFGNDYVNRAEDKNKDIH